jgi:hypothetical protein
MIPAHPKQSHKAQAVPVPNQHRFRVCIGTPQRFVKLLVLSDGWHQAKIIKHGRSRCHAASRQSSGPASDHLMELRGNQIRSWTG